MANLEIKYRPEVMTISEKDKYNEVLLSYSSNYFDELTEPIAYINKEQAQQIINHLKEQFEL